MQIRFRSTLLMLGWLLAFPQFSIAQVPEWGEFPVEQLKMTTYEPDPDAHAVILSDVGEWRFRSSSDGMGLRAILSRHIRIKILSEPGFELADTSLTYVSADKFERINRLEAQTINY